MQLKRVHDCGFAPIHTNTLLRVDLHFSLDPLASTFSSQTQDSTRNHQRRRDHIHTPTFIYNTTQHIVQMSEKVNQFDDIYLGLAPELGLLRLAQSGLGWK